MLKFSTKSNYKQCRKRR